MKKSLFVAAFAALAVVACKKTEAVDTTTELDSVAVVAPADSLTAPVVAGDSANVVVETPVVVEADKVVVEAPATEVKK